MNIGNITCDNNIFLAPMAGITDIPFRILCKENGCGLVYTEMVSAKGLHYNDIKTKALLETNEKERPVAAQIFGSDPEIMAQIAKELDVADLDIIDINMGCPTPKITKNGSGSALMLDPSLAGKIIKTLSNSVEKPVTVKIRKGWDADRINAVEIAKIAQENGAKAIAVHGRMRDQFYSGRADWNIIREVKQSVTIPVIGNGDVFGPEDAKKMLKDTGCDAVMIGRGARGNPWIFKKTIEYIKNKKIPPKTTNEEKFLMIKKHLDMLVEYKGEYTGLREMRKHIAWYLKGMRGSAQIRDRVFKMQSRKEVLGLLEEYFLAI